ncbi:transglycosylase domain-containing protein [Halomonas sp. V046]|uniref:transglycosylase domain-containing protein n=1 Tax=Halomonas sp. V046 TaxID=3459611 RepID=UPI004044D278
MHDKGLVWSSRWCLRPCVIVALALAVVIGVGAGRAVEQWVASAPRLVDARGSVPNSPAVLDRAGEPLSLFLSDDGFWRIDTAVEDVDPAYLDMLLAYEDKRFYAHRGVDWLALARASLQALWHRDVVSGASTLTMQVVRLLEGQPTRTPAAKLGQIRAALALERRLSKREILTLYLNLAPMGGNLEGVASASRAYFAKSPLFLSAAEAALLVAIPQSPAQRVPYRRPDIARAARDRVLDLSRARGLLSEAVVVEAKAEAMPTTLRPMPRLAWHLASDMLAEARLNAASQPRGAVDSSQPNAAGQRRSRGALDSSRSRSAVDSQPEAAGERRPRGAVDSQPDAAVDSQPDAAGERRPRGALDSIRSRGAVDSIRSRGAVDSQPDTAGERRPRGAVDSIRSRGALDSSHLRLETTLDAELQRRLEAMLARWVGQQVSPISAALLVADYRSGEVRARIGAPDPFDARRSGYVDMAKAIRSPGSTLKPLIYALGFDDGLIHPETLINDAPRDFDGWSPSNFDGRFRGPVTVRQALQESLNLPAVSVLESLGPTRLLGAMGRSGAEPKLPGDRPPGLAIGLGGVGVTLEDMVAVYAMIANGGRSVELTTQRTLIPSPAGPPGSAAVDGRAPGSAARRVISARASWYLADILRQTPRAGLGARDRVAFKTGTSYGHRDTWAIGFDGRHVIGVLVGRPDNGAMPGSLGADSAGPLLFSSFDTLGITAPNRTPPADAVIAATGDLPRALRTFRDDVDAVANPLAIVAPRDGAEVYVTAGSASLFVRFQGGRPPFRWLINNRPVAADALRREVALDEVTGGFHRITVIDALGHSANTTVRLVN